MDQSAGCKSRSEGGCLVEHVAAWFTGASLFATRNRRALTKTDDE
jgi:hypothetical protein